jgi:hypothetical protein
VLLALACAGVARADNPTVRINGADQAKAVSSLVRLKDFGVGWTGGPKTPSKLTAPNCPGFNPKESDLVVTGHAEAQFAYHGQVILNQDTQVLETSGAVKTDFSRTVQPKLPGCLAYQLKSSGKGQVTNAAVRTLALPRVGDVSAAYRAVITVRVNGKSGKFIRDFIFFGQGRLEYSLVVDGPMAEADQLAPFETAIARILVKRALTGNVA